MMKQPRTLWILLPAALAAVWLWLPVGPPGWSSTFRRLSAEDRPKAELQPPFVPFLQKHCLHCHGEKTRRADLALHLYRDEASILKDRKTWESVLHVVRSGEMPPKKRPRPDAAEVAAFLGSVEATFARADRDARPDPGRVTVRRLNRSEYNNTIRDLIGVDFQPADDFPADDVGHGFDNIGDVLSVSPLLLERYLVAAESIAQQAIAVEPPRPAVRHLEGRFLLPFLEPSRSRGIRWRPLSGTDTLRTTYRLTAEGDYVLRVRAYGTSPDAEPARLALLADGKELKSFDVKGTEKDSVVCEAPVAFTPGEHRLAVSLLNPTRGDKPRSLFVRYLELVGPRDVWPPSHRRLLACTPGLSQREQTREILTRFASRAYRRPATATEVERLVRLVDDAVARGEKWEAGIRFAVQAALVSPKFLFRFELDDRPDSPGPHPLDDYQLASRLSYFLWSSMPDDELFALAGRKALAANLDAQVRRMLGDPRAKALVDNFAMQWLQLGRLKLVAPDPKLFPSFNEKLRAAMLEETSLFVAAVFREDRSILDLIDADFTFLNEPLARHYGIVDTAGTRAGEKPARPDGKPIYGDKFQRVHLSGGVRGGLLTQASVLTVTSNPTRTSPVKRGRWVLEQILGTPPPPPPPDVPELAEGARAVLSGSLRQRMEQHRTKPSCAICHARMDPIGFGFENFDAVGAFRARDGDFPIDPSATLPDGQSFKGPDELKAILKGKKELFARCLTEKMLTYALGRGLESYDRPAVDRIVAALARNEYKFSTLVTEIARSDPFRLRRGKDGKP
jgi:mono/diheme cytochrome c family protein